ncbi:MAG: HNH endonuclease [Spirochaetes bacterium]|nr:HNH endonuclease [Spirochaetota bacterium]
MLSDVKTLILTMLKEKEWVSSKELLKKTKQKYFDRRIRELKDELGYDIIVKNIKGEPHYKLQSDKIGPIKQRTYLSKQDRDDIKSNLNNDSECPLCGRKFNATIKTAFDHRVPLIKGGNGTPENYQVICFECNNQKRSQCRHCELNCNDCFLAFPEKYPPAIFVRFNDISNYAYIKEKSEKLGLSISECVETIIEKSK